MDVAGLVGQVLVVLVAWMVLSVPLAIFAGRLIAFGTGELADRDLPSSAALVRPAAEPLSTHAAA